MLARSESGSNNSVNRSDGLDLLLNIPLYQCDLIQDNRDQYFYMDSSFRLESMF